MLRAKGPVAIPPLTLDGKQWVRDNVGKANMLADAFKKKSRPPPALSNEYTPIAPSQHRMSGFLPIRRRAVRKVL